MLKLTDGAECHAINAIITCMFLKPEGVEQSVSETLFLELAPANLNSSKSVSFSIPPDVVMGSQRASMVLFGMSSIFSSQMGECQLLLNAVKFTFSQLCMCNISLYIFSFGVQLTNLGTFTSKPALKKNSDIKCL